MYTCIKQTLTSVDDNTPFNHTRGYSFNINEQAMSYLVITY